MMFPRLRLPALASSRACVFPRLYHTTISFQVPASDVPKFERASDAALKFAGTHEKLTANFACGKITTNVSFPCNQQVTKFMQNLESELSRSDLQDKKLKDFFETCFEDEDPEKIYDRWAFNYEKDSIDTAGFSSPWEIAKIAEEHSNSHSSVLDAGCGTGLLGQLLTKKKKLDGFDLSEKMLEIATSKEIYDLLKKHSISDTPWPFENEAYDIVLCNGVLKYVNENLENALSEFGRVLCTGGRAILMIRNDDIEKWTPAMKVAETKSNLKLQATSKEYINFVNADGKDRAPYKIYTLMKFKV